MNSKFRRMFLGQGIPQAATWLRVGLLCLAGVSPQGQAQPAMPSTCAATEVAMNYGFFALRVADVTIGLVASADALRQPGEPPFAAIVVPSRMDASMSPGTRDRGANVLPAAQTRSGSALVRSDLPVSIESAQGDRVSVSIVMYNAPSGNAHPIAAMVVDSTHWRTTRVLLASLSLPDTVRGPPDLDLARNEHLYTLAFRQPAEALFCEPSSNGACDGGPLLSQGEVLERIAVHRECALGAQPHHARATLRRWRVVNLHPGEVLPGPKARVSARVFDRKAPVAGAQLQFSRLPHSACTATTEADGTAACVLADTYGHDGGHPEFDRAPVMVTFTGDLRGDPILLPTTKLLATDNRAPQSFLLR